MPTGWSARERRTTLKSYGLSREMGTEALQEVVALAARLTDRPMAMVSLVEGGRQWFIASVGMDLEETSLEDSICSAVMHEPGVTVIEDTLCDPRSRDRPICLAGGGVRFYAGAPLTAPNGSVLGMLGVMDTKPGTLDDLQRDLLSVLSRQVMAQLDLRRALRRADVLRREVDHRVKNSLQSVASLTRLQARRTESAEVREALEIVGRRIGTVAALNSEIYRNDPGQQLALKPFLVSVTDLVRESAPEGISVTLDCADIHISAADAGAVAIIVNEFSTNSFKHAFPDDREGEVEVRIAQIGPSLYVLDCRDDGIGRTSEDATIGLGLAIIESAIDQLNGEEIELRPERGHALRVEFGAPRSGNGSIGHDTRDDIDEVEQDGADR